MNLTLKKLKANESMSEETLCFSADLYENGKLVAHVSNVGQGGPTSINPAKGLFYSDVKHLDNLDVECIILTIAEEMLFIKSSQVDAFVLKKDNKLYTSKTKNGSFAKMKKMGGYLGWLNNKLRQFKLAGYVVLNTNI